AVLFVGPLYEAVVVDGEWRAWSWSALKRELSDSWIGYRNVVVAPASEELVFRALTIPLYLLAHVSPTRIVFTTPLVFGLAHVHHLAEYLQSRTPEGRRVPPVSVWVAGILRSTFQFAFTSLFGFFAAFVFLRTGSLYAAIAAHSFCNWQGFPRVTGRVGQSTALAPPHATPDVAQGTRDEDAHVSVRVGNSYMQPDKADGLTGNVPLQGPQNLGMAWTWVYYVLLVVGAFGFYKLLFPLTESNNALATF
ncbi:CAAX protease self-immunity, partial [Teratosphaeria destructans]